MAFAQISAWQIDAVPVATEVGFEAAFVIVDASFPVSRQSVADSALAAHGSWLIDANVVTTSVMAVIAFVFVVAAYAVFEIKDEPALAFADGLVIFNSTCVVAFSSLGLGTDGWPRMFRFAF